jgi:putative salt-induced outer membrane protein
VKRSKEEPLVKAIHYLLALLVVLFGVAGVHAEEEEIKEKNKKLSDEAEISFVNTTGNTEVTTFSGKNTLKYKFSEKWEGTWFISGLYGKSDGEKNAERYITQLRADYKYSERTYFYGAGGWLQDKFAGFDARYSAGPGAGYRFLIGPKHFLNGELGINYTVEDYTDGTDRDFPEGRAFAEYEFAFIENNKFTQSVTYLQDFDDTDNYKVISITALQSALNSFLSLKLGYMVWYKNKPRPSDLDETDTELTAAIVFNY